MEFEFEIEGKIHKISVDFKGGIYQLNLGNEFFEVNAQEISDHCFSLIIQGGKGAPSPTLRTPHSTTVFHAEKDGRIHLSMEGEKFLIKVPTPGENRRTITETPKRENFH